MAGIASIARGGSVGYPVRVLIARKGDMTFENLLRRLRCKRCRAVKPAPVYLVAGHHRTRRGGPDADWSIALAPPVFLRCTRCRRRTPSPPADAWLETYSTEARARQFPRFPAGHLSERPMGSAVFQSPALQRRAFSRSSMSGIA
jgi:hypothetical protein